MHLQLHPEDITEDEAAERFRYFTREQHAEAVAA